MTLERIEDRTTTQTRKTERPGEVPPIQILESALFQFDNGSGFALQLLGILQTDMLVQNVFDNTQRIVAKSEESRLQFLDLYKNCTDAGAANQFLKFLQQTNLKHKSDLTLKVIDVVATISSEVDMQVSNRLSEIALDKTLDQNIRRRAREGLEGRTDKNGVAGEAIDALIDEVKRGDNTALYVLTTSHAYRKNLLVPSEASAAKLFELVGAESVASNLPFISKSDDFHQSDEFERSSFFGQCLRHKDSLVRTNMLIRAEEFNLSADEQRFIAEVGQKAKYNFERIAAIKALVGAWDKTAIEFLKEVITTKGEQQDNRHAAYDSLIANPHHQAPDQAKAMRSKLMWDLDIVQLLMTPDYRTEYYGAYDEPEIYQDSRSGLWVESKAGYRPIQSGIDANVKVTCAAIKLLEPLQFTGANGEVDEPALCRAVSMIIQIGCGHPQRDKAHLFTDVREAAGKTILALCSKHNLKYGEEAMDYFSRMAKRDIWF
jgi:hypothetical protein